MNSNAKDKTSNEEREQFLYAQARILQKRRLNWHFVIFLVGSVFIIVINQFFGIGEDFFVENWFIWAILIWAFLLVIHFFKVYVTNSFMGREWENEQLVKLREKQRLRMIELENQVEKERKQIKQPEKTETFQKPFPPLEEKE